jgi:hypothetical protein
MTETTDSFLYAFSKVATGDYFGAGLTERGTRTVLSSAVALLDESGDNSKEASVYRKLASAPETKEAEGLALTFLDAVEERGFTKNASAVLGKAWAAAQAAPGVLQGLGTIGLTAGVPAGALYWVLKREAEEGDDELELKKAVRDEYLKSIAKTYEKMNKHGRK